MALKDRIQRIVSYFFPVKLKTYRSEFSGELYIYMVNGRKILDTATVNYSFNSLHKVFRQAFASIQLNPNEIEKVLVLGLGGGSVVSLLRNNHHITAPITAVEIDPIIVDIAELDFSIHHLSPLNIIVSDAEIWMQQNTSTFDIICVDLFINAEVPSIFLNTAFIDLLLKATNNNGTIFFNIMIMNDRINSAFNSIYSYLNNELGRRIKSATYIQVEENNRVLIIKK